MTFFYDFKTGNTLQKCLLSLCGTFINERPLEKTLYNSFAEFRRIPASARGESREGRPKSVVFPNNVDAMHKND